MKLATPIGNLELHATYCGVDAIRFTHQGVETTSEKPHRLERRAAASLQTYFSGTYRVPFNQDLPLYLKGTAFQVMVWNELLKIPYGQRVSYKEFAASFGRSDAVRAVSTAIGKNPLPIIIPCHRVIGSDGRMHGYLGGTDAKRWLLQHEQHAEVPSAVI